MTEQKIEKTIVDKLVAALAAANVTGVQVTGAWQSADAGELKGEEDGVSRGYLTVKVAPREHETFTCAESSMSVSAELNVRAEMDERGVDYLAVTGAASSVLYAWQRAFATYETDFAIANEFAPTGFRLDGGACGLDRTNGVWTWQQNFTVQGIILN